MFIEIVLSAVAFIIALGILISIHEFGHFWVARKVGIKVLKYSIGFGKPLWKHTGKVDNTEYVVSAIPLGGFVKMLDEREGNVSEIEQHRTFNNQPLWARSAVVIAGPLANFLLAILAYWIVMVIGISGTAPLIDPPVLGSAAERAGFMSEDRIVSVNGRATQTWADARVALMDSSFGEDALLQVEVEQADGQRLIRELPITQDQMLKSEGDPIVALGLGAWQPEMDPIVGDLVNDGAADLAGLQIGDRVIRVDDKPIQSWQELVDILQSNAGVDLELTVAREGVEFVLKVTPSPVKVGDRVIGRIGIMGITNPELPERSQVTVKYPAGTALIEALERTWEMSVFTVRMVGKLIVGQAPLDAISGPLSIAHYAGQSASVGIDHYIGFIALISISLAVFNLMPIPVLDGGHLVYFAAEALRGKPLSEHVQLWGRQVGIVMLGGLMFVALYNDIWRLTH